MDPEQHLDRLYRQILGGTAPSNAASSSGDLAQMVKQILANQAAAESRRHVGPYQWHSDPGSDFWLVIGNAAPALNTGHAAGLSEAAGWTVTGPTLSSTEAADFLSDSDRDPRLVSLLDASDNLGSPQIFGTYEHGQQAAAILGATPTKLVAEWIGQFPVASNNEDDTGFGFTANGFQTTATHVAFIYSDGTNFKIRNKAAAADTGAAVDTNVHKWKIELAGSTAEWFIDDVSQGTIALVTDFFPCGWAANIRPTTGANDVAFNNLHVWYE